MCKIYLFNFFRAMTEYRESFRVWKERTESMISGTHSFRFFVFYILFYLNILHFFLYLYKTLFVVITIQFFYFH